MRVVVYILIAMIALFVCCGEEEEEGPSIPTPVLPTVDLYPAWHPFDMNKIAYCHCGEVYEEYAYSVWVVDISTGESQCIIRNAFAFDWSPDGRYMVGVGAEGRGVRLFDLETGERRRLACPDWKDECQHYHPRFSPCGTKIAYYSEEGDYDLHGIWILDLTTMERRQISRHSSLADWSPDGKYILTEGLQIISSEDGSLIREIRCSACPSSRGGLAPACWSPDGERIAFGGLCYTGKGRYPYTAAIYTINIDGSDETMLLCGGATPSWSPDGSMIAYVDSSMTGHRGTAIWVMNADGSNRRQVTLLE